MHNKQLSIRIGIVIFWLGAIVTFLMLPSWLPSTTTDRSINVFAWTELIDFKKVAEFEKRTGIKVNIGYYENNEELYAKIKITGGVGYDLLMPTDYLVETLIKEGLVQKIDRSKLNFWQSLDPQLLNLYNDPHNEYAIPYLWSVYGLGVNKTFFTARQRQENSFSCKTLFNQKLSTGPFMMIEDPRELALFTAFCLYGTIDGIDDLKMEEITRVLVEQKKYVLLYNDYASPYVLASGQVAIAVMGSPYAFRVIEHDADLTFIIPQEGAFAMIETLVVPSASKKQELVYEFLNFLYEQDVMQHHVDETYFFPARRDVADAMLQRLGMNRSSSWQFFRNVLSEEMVNKFWLSLKSSSR